MSDNYNIGLWPPTFLENLSSPFKVTGRHEFTTFIDNTTYKYSIIIDFGSFNLC